MRHCIYWDHFIDVRSGGPTGYLAHLRRGLDRIPERDIEIWLERRPGGVDESNANKLKTVTDADVINHIQYFSNPANFQLSDDEFAKIMVADTRSVHLHTYGLALKVFQTFKRKGVFDVPLMLTSHCPESNGKEFADLYRGKGIDPALTDKLEDVARFIEAMSFKCADIWVFPSPEAMEPYYLTIPDFHKWAEKKDVRYVATGAHASTVSLSPEEAKRKFGVEGKKVISFVGRHNEVKGYDIFCKALLALLDERDDIVVLVAGAQGTDLPTPSHERWIELGWYNAPGEVMKAADVFVLPNRMTFYDLVLIEALAMKTTVLASATGGNKSVHQLTQGAISLYDGSAEDLKAKLIPLLSNGEEAKTLKSKLEVAYDTYFKPEIFARRYADLVQTVWSDYGLEKKRPEFYGNPTTEKPKRIFLEKHVVRDRSVPLIKAKDARHFVSVDRPEEFVLVHPWPNSVSIAEVNRISVSEMGTVSFDVCLENARAQPTEFRAVLTEKPLDDTKSLMSDSVKSIDDSGWRLLEAEQPETMTLRASTGTEFGCIYLMSRPHAKNGIDFCWMRVRNFDFSKTSN